MGRNIGKRSIRALYKGEWMNVEIIRVQIQQNGHGYFIATSKDLPGLYMAHRNLQSILDDVPAVLELIYKFQFKQKIKVMPAKYRREKVDSLENYVICPLTSDSPTAKKG